MKAFFKSVVEYWGAALMFVFAMAMLWLGETCLAVGFGIKRGYVVAGPLIFALIAGTVKTITERWRARQSCEALDKAIKLWATARDALDQQPDAENLEALRAAYSITIRTLEKERDRLGGHRGG